MAHIGYTAEQVLHIVQSIKDPVYFIENNIKIYHPTDGLVPFKLHPFQKNLVEAFHNGKHSVVVASRQIGKTQVSLAYLLWYVCANTNKTIVIGTVNNFNSQILIAKIKEMISTMPSGLVPKVIENFHHSIYFENGCRISTQIISEDFSCGMTASLYYVDELAYAKKAGRESFINLMFPTLSHGHSQLIVTSTSSPADEVLPTLYEIALSSPETFNAIKIKWNEFPGRDESFKQQMIDAIGEDSWNKEYEVELINKE